MINLYNYFIKKFNYFFRKIKLFFKIINIFFVVNIQLIKSFRNNYTGLKINLPRKKTIISPNKNIIDTAIVFQGPIYSEFTINTIKRYFDIYPNLFIFYSTWEDESPLMIKKLKALNVKIILNKKPSYRISGNSNQDLMILSMKSAIDEVRKYNFIKFICKHRGDQRISHPNWIESLRSLIKLFPSKNILNDSGKRIITHSGDSGKLRLFGLSDQFQFGCKEDINNLWDVPIFPKGYGNFIKEDKQFLEDTRKSKIGITGENYIHYSYYKKLNPKGRWTWKDYINLIRIKFIVLDDSSLNFEWRRKIYYANASSWFENFVNLNPFKFPNDGKLSCSMSFLDYLIILDEDYKTYFWDKYTFENWNVYNDQEPYNYESEVRNLGGELKD